MHFVTYSPLVSGGAGYKQCGYPSASFLNLLAITLNLSQLELLSNQEGVLTQLTICDSSALERVCKCQTYIIKEPKLVTTICTVHILWH